MNAPETPTDEVVAGYLPLTEIERFIERTKRLVPRPCHIGHDSDCGV